MKDKQTSPQSMSDQTKTIEQAMRRAVRQALVTHKRAGNTVATWRDGRVVLVSAEEIPANSGSLGKHFSGKEG